TAAGSRSGDGRDAMRVALAVALLGGLAALLLHRDPPAAPVETPAAAPRAPELVTREEPESAVVELPAATLAAIGAALGAEVARSGGIKRAVAGARAGSIDSLELGRRLRETTAGRPELGQGLLRALEDEASPAISLQLA